MADLNDRTRNVNIWNDAKSKAVSVITDGAVERLATTSSVTVNALSLKDSSNLDAFARLRVSNPVTIFDSKQIHDNLPLFWDDQQVTGTGTTSVHTPNAARTRLGVSLNTAGKRVRQTFMRFNYQPGKSQLIMLTGVLGTGSVGITQELGYFDDENGLFWRCDDGVLSVVQRSFVTGVAVDTVVAQSAWNLDKMDGTGASGINMDVSKTQLYFLDFEWLGVGRVRFGMIHNGIPIYMHQFINSGVVTDIFMSTPNLPLRYSIENKGTGPASTMDHLCSTVISEGGITDLGILRYASTAGTFVDAASNTDFFALMAIRLKATSLDETVKIVNISVVNTTNQDYEWKLILNPIVATAVTFTNQINSSVQIASGNADGSSTLIGGIDFAGGFVKSDKASGDVLKEVENALLLGASIAGVRDEIYLAARPFTNNAELEGAITWREIS